MAAQRTALLVVVLFGALIALKATALPFPRPSYVYRPSFFPQNHAASLAASFKARLAAQRAAAEAAAASEKPPVVVVPEEAEDALAQFAEPDARIVDEKRTIALGRPNFRPSKRFAQDEEAAAWMGEQPTGWEFAAEKRSVAVGRQNFRPAKRSVATGRTGFRPAKRSPAFFD
ncbi:hypothetical protein M3Y99_00586000 [Aphelenchoides fujianensis]|nr:hypothetical protein M3Y99_00586000 [Aphelenchoides fujianensis]